MVLGPDGGDLSRRSTKRVTFGPVIITHVPQHRDIALHSTVESHSLSAESTPSSQEEAREAQGVLGMTPDSESSLLLTQAGSTSSLDGSSDVVCAPVPLGKDKINDNDEDEMEECLLPAAWTHSATFPMQYVLSSSCGSYVGCDSSPITSFNCSAPTCKDQELLWESPLSLSPDVTLTSLKRNKRSENDNTETIRSVRHRVEVDTTSPAVCIFCHDSSGVLEKYEGYHVHLACALWCPEVYYDTQEKTLKNLDAVLERCQNIKCASCRQPGAPIGCLNIRCQRSYHLKCAVDSGALLNVKTFELLCEKHSNKPCHS